MSVPLLFLSNGIPSIRKKEANEDSSGNNVHIHDLFLDSEERYEVYTVKAAERPHLLLLSPSSQKKEEEEIEKTEEEELSLIDGCDIPGWRRENLAGSIFNNNNTSSLQSLWNIGASSTLFRRDTQWPIIDSSSLPSTLSSLKPLLLQQQQQLNNFIPNEKSDWSVWQTFLSHPPHLDNDVTASISCPLYSQPIIIENASNDDDNDFCYNSTTKRMTTRFALKYERDNYPVKILDSTIGWKCMPHYHHNTMEEQEKKEDDNKNSFNVAINSSSSSSWLQSIYSGDGSGGWTFENLLKRFGDIRWRFSDTHGQMLSMDTYAKYIINLEGGLTDDSPLGIYDSEFANDDSPATNILKHEYTVPSCFSHDLFHLSEKEENNTLDQDDDDDFDDENDYAERPPWRWILIGPARSGTGMHIDPLYTNAWVTLLQGQKRWMLFPPCTPGDKIGMVKGLPQIPSSIWFRDYYNKVTCTNSWKKEWKPVEVLQNPGETVFVPAGWPHIVLNLHLSVAVTHNYASEFSPFFTTMWKDMVIDEPNYAKRWFRDGIQDKRPDLAAKIKNFHNDAIEEGETWAQQFSFSIS